MAVTDVSELRKKRKAKHTRNVIIKAFIVILICGCIVVAVMTRDVWYPSLNGILTKVPAPSAPITRDTSELAEGNFPIKIEGGSGYQIMRMDNCLALIDDSRFHIYSTDGKLITEKLHSYANPILAVSSGKSLIYDLGGQDFSLEGKYKTVYSKAADNVILLARLADNDNAAVVTKSDNFLAMLKVYNDSGEPVFTYYSYDKRIVNVTFTDSGKGCILTVLYAENGSLRSGMIRFDFTDTEPKWTSEPVDTLALDVTLTPDGNVLLIGDTVTALYSSEGQLLATYTYKDPIIDYDASGNVAAVMTSNSEKRTTTLTIMKKDDLTSAVSVNIDHSAKKAVCDGDLVHVLVESEIYTYDITGQRIAYASLEDDYDDICKIDKFVFLLGYDSVNRINYNV